MYHISLKNWTHSMHMPKYHNITAGLTHIVHDDRFWALVGAAVLFAVLIGMAIIANRAGMPAPDFSPTRTFFPY